MIDIKELASNPDLIEEMRRNISLRRVHADVDETVKAYQDMIDMQKRIEMLRAESNKIAKRMVKADAEARLDLAGKGKDLKSEIADLSKQDVLLKDFFQKSALRLPNWISPDVPEGNDDVDNRLVSYHLSPTEFDFQPKDHLELGKNLDLLDFESGAKVAGSKFYFLKNEAVLLQHAIKSYAFRKAIEKGFTPLITPDMARNSVMEGTGFSPRGEESNTYTLEGEDLSLVATAEVAVGGMHSGEVFSEEDLPLLYVAESHCFRREAGTAGRASKGLYRVHQFEKIELFAFTTPQQSEKTLEMIRALEEEIYQDLGLPYRLVMNCSGDLGNPAYKKYDIEAWMPGKGENGDYGEVTSASNCLSYQSRRLNVKFKNATTNRNEYVHTLNGTAVALSRTPVAIMENYQTSDGGIKVPEVLIPYTGFEEIKPKVSKKHGLKFTSP